MRNINFKDDKEAKFNLLLIEKINVNGDIFKRATGHRLTQTEFALVFKLLNRKNLK